MISNVIGSGLGPLLVGAVSDGLGGTGDSLRTAMIIVALLQLLAVAAFISAANVYAKIIARNEAEPVGDASGQ